VIIAREFAVTVLRGVAAERGIVMQANMLGKIKTVFQIVAVIALIANDPAPIWADILVYLALAFTVISGLEYFFGIQRKLAEREAPKAKSKKKA
jgi:CDP-diacylglycerol--glycerol-3-phosphate 3-phosphatidyltransferase